jgi:hypothetical protein
MGINSSPLGQGNKPEMSAMFPKQCGAIGQAHAPPNDKIVEDSALAGLEATLRLVDHIDAALAPHDAVVAVAAPQRFQ